MKLFAGMKEEKGGGKKRGWKEEVRGLKKGILKMPRCLDAQSFLNGDVLMWEEVGSPVRPKLHFPARPVRGAHCAIGYPFVHAHIKYQKRCSLPAATISKLNDLATP